MTMLVIVGTRTDAHSLRSQAGIGSQSDCLLGQLDRILRISDSEAGLRGEIRRCCSRRGWVWRWCIGIVRERQTEVGIELVGYL